MAKSKKRAPLTVVPFTPKEPDRRWMPETCLAEFLDEVRSGKIQPASMIVFYLEPMPNGGRRPGMWLQNMPVSDQIAFGHWLIDQAFRSWRGED